jgi:lipid II isoglutaminyl synthase (glutamine-hydrolysing)
MIAEAVSPGFIRRRAQLCADVILVSGTNGKTTTSSMLRAILNGEGTPTIGNETGANLRQGIATSLLKVPKATEMAVLEVDEATLTSVTPELEPRLLVLTNVFRDQMDRFGEVERVIELLDRSCGLLPEDATILANVDDPLLWPALEPRDPVGFGIRLVEGPTSIPSMRLEAEVCSRCGEPLVYSSRTFAHLGVASCSGCSWRSTEPTYLGTISERRGLRSVTLEVAGERLTLPTGGVHNAYNAIAAISAADHLGVSMSRAVQTLRSFQPRFGRAEQVHVDGRSVWLALMKNPGAADVLIDEIADDPHVGSVVVSVNDAAADGRDISWIWDADFERLVRAGLPLVPSGSRVGDVAVRLKYTGGSVGLPHSDPLDAITAALAACPSDRSPVVLATYTAMLNVRKALGGQAASLVDTPV